MTMKMRSYCGYCVKEIDGNDNVCVAQCCVVLLCVWPAQPLKVMAAENDNDINEEENLTKVLWPMMIMTAANDPSVA